MDLRETPLGGEILYRGKIVDVRVDRVALPDGKEATREVVVHPGGVAVVAVTRDRRVVAVRQYRYPMGEVLLEIPAGKLEPGEDPADGGRRELLEETGYTPGRYEPLGVLYPTPGYCQEKLHLFLATDLTQAGANPDEDEWLEVVHVPLDEMMARILDGRVRDAKTIAGVLMARGRLSDAASGAAPDTK
ncbi:MAG: NUDIX hydrolase [Oscillospiraceae bacterium]|nr:NUDIX hydrolase [Oscillospiraceae bacterium]